MFEALNGGSLDQPVAHGSDLERRPTFSRCPPQLLVAHPLVVATGVIEPAAETWPPPAQQWQLLGSLRGVIRFA